MTRPAAPRSRTSVKLVLASLVLVAALTLAACASGSSTSAAATTPAAAVGSPSKASALAGSPSPVHAASASGFGDGVYLVGTDIPAGTYKGTTVSDVVGAWRIANHANGSSLIASDPVTLGISSCTASRYGESGEATGAGLTLGSRAASTALARVRG